MITRLDYLSAEYLRLMAINAELLAALKFALSEASGFACPATTEAVMRQAIANAEAQ